MNHLLRVIASLALVVIAFGTIPQGAAADATFTVAPTLLEFAGDPGSSLKQIVKVTNEGTEPLHFSVTIKDTVPNNPSVSASSWLRIDVNDFELAPGKTKEVVVTATVPGDASVGGHYATVFFQVSASALGERVGRVAAGSGMGAQVGSVFLLTVRGPALSLKAEVARVVPVAVGPDRIGFRLEIKNTGNVHTVPKATVELRDLSGNIVGQLFLPEVPPILPGSTRSYNLKGWLSVPPGDYKAMAKVDYSWEEFQAEATQVDPKQWTQQQVEGSVTFNSIPKLRIAAIKPVIVQGEPAQFQVSLENVGDVEVMPAGVVDVLTERGERAFTLNIGDGKWAVQPHSTSAQEVNYRGVLPAGNYSVTSSFNYYGQGIIEQSVPLRVERDVIPPEAPTVKPAPQADLQPTGGNGLSTWVLAAAGGGAIVLVGGGLAFFWLRRRGAG